MDDPADDEQPATKGELRKLGTDLRGEMRAMENRLMRDIGALVAQALNVQQEQFQSWARAFDDKYDARMATLERELAEP